MTLFTDVCTGSSIYRVQGVMIMYIPSLVCPQTAPKSNTIALRAYFGHAYSATQLDHILVALIRISAIECRSLHKICR